MPTYRLDIEYEGTRYHGWQAQPGLRTVQGELIRAAEAAVGEPVELQGAGRTDRGVHALGQVAHLRTRRYLPAEVLWFRINDALPPDIAVWRLERVHARFHARRDAIGRSYLYQIATRRVGLGGRFLWWLKDPLNREAMGEALRGVVGRHHFGAFSDPDREGESPWVVVREARLCEEGPLLIIQIQASHFLWKMVCRLVGVLVAIGRGEIEPERMTYWLRHPQDRTPARWTAPPSGLFLERVVYREADWPLEVRPVLRLERSYAAYL